MITRESLWAVRRNYADNVERRLDGELRAHGVNVPKRAGIDARLNLMNMDDAQRQRIVEAAQRERKRENNERDGGVFVAYVEKIPAREGFIAAFASFIERLLSRVEAEERERRKRCFCCGIEIVMEEGDGKTVRNEVLAIANGWYSAWDVVCSVCGAVHRTVAPLELSIRELLISDKEKQRAKDEAEHTRLIRQKEKEQDKVDKWRYRVNHRDQCNARTRASIAKNKDEYSLEKENEYRPQNAEHNREKYRDEHWGPIRVPVGRGYTFTNAVMIPANMPVTKITDSRCGYTNADMFFGSPASRIFRKRSIH